MPTLAQSLVPDLEQPAALVRYTLENPYPAAVVGGLAAIVAFYVLVQAGKAKAGLIAAVILLAIGGGVFGLASAVETSRERVMQQSTALVDAAATGREQAVADLLADDVRLRVAERPFSVGRGAILSLVGRVGTQNLVSSYSLNEVRAGRVEGDQLITQAQVSAAASGGGGSWPTWWQLHWTRTADGDWKVSEIVWLTLGPTRPGAGILLP
jgi:ketosteroid isomerase-like protein